MKLTPLDIQQMRFSTRLRGYDREEVDHFLEVVTGAYEEVLKDHQSLQEQGAGMERKLLEWRRKEETISQAVLATQDVVKDLKQNASREAELLIKEAELRAETLVRDAQAQVVEMERELVSLRKQRLIAVDKIRGVMQMFQVFLDVEDEDRGRGYIENGMQHELQNSARLHIEEGLGTQ
tara:strand:- start:1071 stop:1607 length:537 start_codon:yes stop_codon:yes gene_type:complete